MHWLIDGYNVIRRDPELTAAERVSLEAGRAALCRALAPMARRGSDAFTVVFDGAGRGGEGGAIAGVRVVFSSARENADRVLARLAVRGGAVVSNDRDVQRAAVRAGAIAVSADQFLAKLDRLATASAEGEASGDGDDGDEAPRGLKKGNPRRLGKKARATAGAMPRIRLPVRTLASSRKRSASSITSSSRSRSDGTWTSNTARR